MNEDPVPKTVELLKVEYHLSVVPAAAVAVNVTVPVPQRLPPVADNTTGVFTTISYGSDIIQFAPAPSLMIARNQVVAVNVPVLCVAAEPKSAGVPLTKPLVDDCHKIDPPAYPVLGAMLNVVLPL